MGAVAQVYLALIGLSGTLAHQVHQSARHVLTVQYGSGALEHLNPLKPEGLCRGGVGVGLNPEAIAVGTVAVVALVHTANIENVTGKTITDRELGRGNTRHVVENIGQRLGILVFDALPGSNGNRPRCFSQRRVRLGRRQASFRLVAIVRSLRPFPLSGDLNFLEFRCVILVLGKGVARGAYCSRKQTDSEGG